MTVTTSYAPHKLTDELAKEAQDRIFITVSVKMDHVAKYGREPQMRLTYGSRYPVKVGDIVLCPPTRLKKTWTKGIVVALGSRRYRGPVKYIKPLGGGQPLSKS